MLRWHSDWYETEYIETSSSGVYSNHTTLFTSFTQSKQRLSEARQSEQAMDVSKMVCY